MTISHPPFHPFVFWMEPKLAVSDFYNKTLELQRVSFVASEFSAAGVETWTDTPANVRGCIQPITGRELQQYNKTTADVSHKGFFDAALDLRPMDRLVDGSTTYQVVYCFDAAGRGHHQEALLLERKDD